MLLCKINRLSRSIPKPPGIFPRLFFSRLLYKYLLKYASDHAYNGYKYVCQQKLLRAGGVPSGVSRRFPPTVLEWRANKKRVNMALEARCADGHAR